MMRIKMMAVGVLTAGSMALCGCSESSAGKEPGPIVLELPSSGSESSSPFPGFSWSEHSEAFRDMGKPVEYEIQIASDAAFKTLVDEDRVALNRYVHDKPLTPGAYHWRVRAIPHSGDPTNWSVVLGFAINEPDLVLTVDVSGDPVLGAKAAVAKAKEAVGQSTPFHPSQILPTAPPSAPPQKQIPSSLPSWRIGMGATRTWTEAIPPFPEKLNPPILSIFAH